MIFTVVQARTRSTRRPGKVLAEFPGGPLMIDAVIRRATEIGYPVALTIPDDDPEMEKVCMARDWQYFVGPEDDLVVRYLTAASGLQAKHLIRVTSDCPFVDVWAARQTVRWHIESDADLTTYHLAEGRGVQVIRTAALVLAEQRALAPPFRWRDSPDEFILDHPGIFNVQYMKFSVDTPEDLETARRRANDND